MINLKKETEGVLNVLVVAPELNSVLDILGSAAKEYDKVCYVTFSRPYHSFIKYFQVNKIDMDKFFFIDCITKLAIKRPEKTKNCIFLSGPNAFTEVNDTIRNVLQKKRFDLLIFDSLSSLLIYEKEDFVMRFLHGLAAMIKASNCKSVFIVLKKDVETNTVKNLGMLIDKTLLLK